MKPSLENIFVLSVHVMHNESLFFPLEFQPQFTRVKNKKDFFKPPLFAANTQLKLNTMYDYGI